MVIKEKYLIGKEFLLTEQLYLSSLRTPGEARPSNREVMEQGIIEGVQKGIFGIGELDNDKPICRYFKERASVSFSDSEVLISELVCKDQRKKEEKPEVIGTPIYPPSDEIGVLSGEKVEEESKGSSTGYFKDNLLFRFIVPKGKVSDIMRVMNYLQSKFGTLEVELIATGGKISKQEYEDKVKEAFRQLGIEIELEE